MLYFRVFSAYLLIGKLCEADDQRQHHHQHRSDDNEPSEGIRTEMEADSHCADKSIIKKKAEQDQA